ncbi:nicotinate-nucleotide adenylyltransferase [Allorhodopirellula heiligendammensis]|uniref:Probable nicotinate-nucleotide adenylyltransferase n=1 Tax=Allorhodopirellula heiligendammensis TaxID=2714739 RepID=A0A5C6C6P1_9BACT|nr:nicotinate-nucleotide adenylyltransferase [Allorhodopirellula heiligendammensis]TWU19151.1 Nicotinate-nucleotide adenylyltransferase [Allorhodopirellula heiligendammensis]
MTSRSGVGVFGGSFDPVHLGHLWIAEAALEHLPVDHVRWVPAATSPLKPAGPVASNSQRLSMLRLALAGQSGHVIDTLELDRDGISYTVDTLEDLRAAFPSRPLFLIIGADSLASFAQWEAPERLLQQCVLAVVRRGGVPSPDYSILNRFASAERVDQCRSAEIMMPQIEISSSDLRQRISQARSIRFRVPHPVTAFLDHTGLYREQVRC